MPDEQRNTSNGKRQHPLWILFAIGKSIKEVIIPVVYFFFLEMGSDSTFIKYGTLALIAYMIYRVISILFNWKNFKYVITNENIEITEGKLKTETRYIALDRIQSVQQNTSFFHRLVGLTSITMLTGATDDNSSVKLEMISHKEAKRVQQQLDLSRTVRDDERETDLEDDVASQAMLRKHYEVTWKEIVRASFTSFAFLALIPILLTIYIKVDDLFAIEDYTENALGLLKLSWILLTVIAIVLLALSAVVGIAVTYIRYGNFQVHSNHERVYIEKGVFSKTHFSIPKGKINAIKFNKNLIRRWLGIVEVELVSAGGLGEDDLQTNILFPFISEKRARHLVPEILPAFRMEADMTKLPKPALWVNLIRPSYLWIFVTVGIFIFRPGEWYISLGLLIIIIALRVIDFYHSRYALNGPFIQIQHGAVSSELTVTTRKKIDELEITESWVQRKFGLASLEISTRAKPILVSTISDIPKEMAVRYYEWYAER